MPARKSMRNSRRFAHFSTFFPSQKVFDICGRPVSAGYRKNRST
jgi:hypothetical protein